MADQPMKKKGRANTAGKPIPVSQLNSGKLKQNGQTNILASTQNAHYVQGPMSNQGPPYAKAIASPCGSGQPGGFPAPVGFNGQPVDMTQWMIHISSQLNDLQQKFAKLDLIEEKTDRMSREISQLNRTVSDLETSTKFCSDSYDELKKTSGQLATELNEIKIENQGLKRQMLEAQARSMKDNLIFGNIPESTGENTETVVREFIEKEMEILDVKPDFEVVHRFGYSANGNPRPIVAKFSKRKDKEHVRSCSFRLRGKPYYVKDQYPKEIDINRGILYPYFKKARNLGMTASLRMDVLIVNRKQYTVDNIGSAPFRPDPKVKPKSRGNPPRHEDHSHDTAARVVPESVVNQATQRERVDTE